MMNKQDDKIKQLFDDYAKELTPRDDLAGLARAEMTASKTERKQPASERKKSNFWIYFACIAPVCVVMIVVIALVASPIFGFVGGIFDGITHPSNPSPPTLTQMHTDSYSYDDVKGRSISLEDCDDVLRISYIKQAYEVVGERYYAFYTDDGELRYIKALLGVRSLDGSFTEIELIAEVNGYVREDLKDIYDNNKRRDELFTEIGKDDSGEYVTKGFFFARDMHFYVYARNGQYSKVAEEIISKIL